MNFNEFLDLAKSIVGIDDNADLKKEIYKCIEDNNIERLKELISKNPHMINEHLINPFNDSNSQLTASHLAIDLNKEEIINLLITSGANVNAFDGNKNTPFQYAIREGKFELVKTMFKKGGQLNLPNDWNETALSCAVKFSYTHTPYTTDTFGFHQLKPERVAIAKFLISNSKEEDWTPSDFPDFQNKERLASDIETILKIKIPFDPETLYEKSLIREENSNLIISRQEDQETNNEHSLKFNSDPNQISTKSSDEESVPDFN